MNIYVATTFVLVAGRVVLPAAIAASVASFMVVVPKLGASPVPGMSAGYVRQPGDRVMLPAFHEGSENDPGSHQTQDFQGAYS